MNSSDRSKLLKEANRIESKVTDLTDEARGLRDQMSSVCSPGEHHIHSALHAAYVALVTAGKELEDAITKLSGS